MITDSMMMDEAPKSFQDGAVATRQLSFWTRFANVSRKSTPRRRAGSISRRQQVGTPVFRVQYTYTVGYSTSEDVGKPGFRVEKPTTYAPRPACIPQNKNSCVHEEKKLLREHRFNSSQTADCLVHSFLFFYHRTGSN
jgi:hypothetical protein